MSERYTKLVTIDGPQWCVGCPVVFDKGALLRDNQKINNILQLQFFSIQKKRIAGICIKVQCIDIMIGNSHDQIFSYMDLNLGCYEKFGSKIPIVLEFDTARKFNIVVEKVLFINGSIWSGNQVLCKLPDITSYTELGVVSEQYKRDAAKLMRQYSVVAVPEEYEEFWYCACGSMNVKSEDICLNCSSTKKDIFDLVDNKRLQMELEEYKEKLKEKLKEKEIADAEDIKRKEEFATQNLKKKKKHIIIASIPVVIILVYILIFNVIPMAKYNSGIKFYNDHKYDEAITIFEEIPNDKDAVDMLKRSKYNKAKNLYTAKKYQEAKDIFDSIGDFKDSVEMSAKCAANNK